MERRKLTKEDIDKVRNIEGFPIAKDEDIIALSDAPYYTACPNPFIEEFIKEHGTPYDEATDDYQRKPFASDVSEGKNDPIYNAHSYHTKVPYKAIMRYIFHYTKPGDIVFDGFCGTGMTGVAAQMCEQERYSSQSLPNIPDNSIDYIFTDPPFGDNLMYSELSFIWEAWLQVLENNQDEAIMSSVQGKGLLEYQQLMTDCFSTYYRVLKPNRWITVEFHNSKNAVWNAIQESLNRAGFVIADVRTLDKQQGSFKQVNNTSAVKQDLVISAYKPKLSLSRRILEKAGQEETAWDFVNQHLSNLPVVVKQAGKIEVVAERQGYLLFDRMVAYHIMSGIPVPIDAADFYKGLDERYLQRDGMYFLTEQVNEYDTARIVDDIEPIRFSLIVSNEKTAIAWLYQQLNTPQTYAEIQPKFMQEIKTVDKFEAMPELAVLLEENFLQDDKGKWYVPDITKEADVAKLREKNLLKEFEGYLVTKGKLKLFRAEAVRVGFAKLWKDKNYKLIVETAERLPEQIIQEDDKLLMYYDISLSRV